MSNDLPANFNVYDAHTRIKLPTVKHYNGTHDGILQSEFCMVQFVLQIQITQVRIASVGPKGRREFLGAFIHKLLGLTCD